MRGARGTTHRQVTPISTVALSPSAVRPLLWQVSLLGGSLGLDTYGWATWRAFCGSRSPKQDQPSHPSPQRAPARSSPPVGRPGAPPLPAVGTHTLAL